LLDESVTDALAKDILALCPSAIYVRNSVSMKEKKDPEIARFANADRRIIVAIDNDFKGLDVTEGVIRLVADRSDEECLFKIFVAFWHSGHRAKSHRRRAYLTNDGLRITNGEVFTHQWHPRPCPHHGEG